MANNIIDIDYEELDNWWFHKKRWLWSLIKSYGKRLQANIESKTVKNESKALNKRLESSFIEEINEIAQTSITLSHEDINKLQWESRFQELSEIQRNEVLNKLNKRHTLNSSKDLKKEHKIRTEEQIEKDQEEKEERRKEKLKKIRDNIEAMINDVQELYQEAHQDIINRDYEKASQKAEEVLENIKYQKEFISKLKSFSNSVLFKVKKPTQIFKRQKDIMTTLLLPNWRDMVLVELEERAKDIKWIAKANMKKQTKEIKRDLSHPRNVEQEFIWEREPMYQWRNIVWFKLNGWVDILSTRRVLYRWNKKVYIVQQRQWQMLYWAISAEWDPITPTYFTKNYKLQWSKLIYEPTENSWEPLEERDLINPTSE